MVERDDATSRQSRRGPGIREAILVGIATLSAVAIAAALTFLLPPEMRELVFRTPLLIVVLIVGTATVLWTITRPGRSNPP